MATKALNILQVNTRDQGGGAERVAWNLFTAYRQRGYGSYYAVSIKSSDDPNVFQIPEDELRGGWTRFWLDLSKRLEMPLEKSTEGVTWRDFRNARWVLSRAAFRLSDPIRAIHFYSGHEDFSFPGTSRLLEMPGGRPDLIHAHNLHGNYFDLRVLPKLSRLVPMLLTLHDAWLLSGHCIHSFACERWRTGCGQCPDIQSYPALWRDGTRDNWEQKKDIYRKSRLYVAAPSRWLMSKVKQSILAPGIVEARVIPNGIDLSVFRPYPKEQARQELGIPLDAKVVLFAGIGLKQNIWKDYQTMRIAVGMAADQVQDQELLFLSIGEKGVPQKVGNALVNFVPFQADQLTVARYFQAADVYLHAARADTFPNSVIEAMACGIPVVATAVGGISEQVEDGCTGFLLPAGDAAGLAARINMLLTDSSLHEAMGREAASRAVKHYDLNQQVESYLNWYEEIVGGIKNVKAERIKRNR